MALVFTIITSLIPMIAILNLQAPGKQVKIDAYFPIEDFEGRRQKKSRWKLRWKQHKNDVVDIRGYLTVSELETAATAESRRYLNINFRGTRQNGLRIAPPAPVFIAGFIRRLEVWVFGFGQPAQLYLDLTDINGRPHRLKLGSLNFKGWKKLSLVPGREVSQRPPQISGTMAGLTFRGFYLKPHFRRLPGLTRLYLDEIGAFSRAYHQTPRLEWQY